MLSINDGGLLWCGMTSMSCFGDDDVVLHAFSCVVCRAYLLFTALVVLFLIEKHLLYVVNK